MRLQKLSRWTGTWPGHMAIYLIFFGLPMSVLFIFLIGVEGTLTPRWAVFILLVNVVASLVLASFIWFSFSKPRIARAAGEKVSKK